LFSSQYKEILTRLSKNVDKIPSGKGDFHINSSYLYKLIREGNETLDRRAGYFSHADLDYIAKVFEKYYDVARKSTATVQPVYD
jgi:hypothetical protein